MLTKYILPILRGKRSFQEPPKHTTVLKSPWVSEANFILMISSKECRCLKDCVNISCCEQPFKAWRINRYSQYIKISLLVQNTKLHIITLEAALNGSFWSLCLGKNPKPIKFEITQHFKTESAKYGLWACLIYKHMLWNSEWALYF